MFQSSDATRKPVTDENHRRMLKNLHPGLRSSGSTTCGVKRILGYNYNNNSRHVMSRWLLLFIAVTLFVKTATAVKDQTCKERRCKEEKDTDIREGEREDGRGEGMRDESGEGISDEREEGGRVERDEGMRDERGEEEKDEREEGERYERGEEGEGRGDEREERRRDVGEEKMGDESEDGERDGREERMREKREERMRNEREERMRDEREERMRDDREERMREKREERLRNEREERMRDEEEEEMEEWEKTTYLSVEKRLISKLLDKYQRQGKMGRPVIHTNDKLTIRFGLSLIQIMDVDESNQILKTSMWYRYEWTDILLRWNPKRHDGIRSVRIPSSRIWLPDILLYNFADDRLQEQRDALVIVHYNGSIQWMPQAILRSSCAYDTKYFPFDVQTCYLKFGSWAYNGHKMDVKFVDQTSFDLSDYVASNEWHIDENNATRNVKHYTCCPEPYPDITFTLALRRKTAFYTFILVLPCTLLSLLTLVIFWVPPESPAKLQLGMSVFVAFFLLLLVLADFTPRAAASIPLIGAYFCLSMVMITLSTVLSCVVTNMYFRGVRINRAPKWMRTCIGSRVAKVFGLNSPKPVTFEPNPKKSNNRCSKKNYTDNGHSFELEQAKIRLFENGNQSSSLHHHNHYQNQHHQQQQHHHRHSNQNQPDNFPDTDEMFLDKDLTYEPLPNLGSSSYRDLLQEVKAIRNCMTDADAQKKVEEEKAKVVQEWRILACITDRIFFVLYVLVNIITITVLFTAT